MVDGPRSLLPASPGVDPGDGAPLPVFTYGSLLEEEFVAQLVEHPIRSEPASLGDFRVDSLHRLVWPVLTRSEGSTVEGRLYRGLDRDDLRRLDAYEGVAEGLYQRTTVEVATASGTEAAAVYLPTPRTLSRYG